MWTHKAWPGQEIPATTPAGGELVAYSRVLNAVEGNTTFYATPRPETVRRWAEAVPSNFRFMFKLPKVITHDRRLRHVDVDVTDFLRAMEPLHPLMDPISIQLPASFGPADLDVLEAFVRGLSSSLPWAVEVRDPAFFDGADVERTLNGLLAGHGVDRITLDSRALFEGPCNTAAEQDAFDSKPRLPVRATATGDRPVVRFIGQTEAEPNPAFWAPWVDTCVRWLADGRRPVVFIHTPDNVVAPSLCRRFHAEVSDRVADLAPLPDPPLAQEPSLFDDVRTAGRSSR